MVRRDVALDDSDVGKFLRTGGEEEVKDVTFDTVCSLISQSRLSDIGVNDTRHVKITHN